jgi:DNA adenine methylase
MALSAFPYPGGKTPYWKRIVPYFPSHHTYVEPFGGSAAVLLNKEPSYAEVLNDVDGDIVHFFEVLREQRDDLVDWLQHVPYSRDVFEEWADDYWAGVRPEDDIERAGRWLYLRFSNFNAALDRRNGFKTGGKRNEARSFRSAIEDLEEICDRLREVTIENQDYSGVIERYDREDTLLYLDPPYVDPNRNYYRQGSDEPFDHASLVDELRDVEGYWVCSYGTLPDGLGDLATVVESYEARYSMRYADRRDEAEERLAMNYDPKEVPRFVTARQSTLQGATGP